MPFSDTEHHREEYWRRHFSYLKKVIEMNESLEAFRSEVQKGNISHEIIYQLKESFIVVADLTDLNPNVLWELGVRQTFENRTITIAQIDTIIPFHFSHKGIFYYNSEHLENEGFEKKFLDALDCCIKYPNETDSPVIEAEGGKSSLYSIVNKEQNQRRVKALEIDIEINEIIYREIAEACSSNLTAKKEGKLTRIEPTRLFNTTAVEFLNINRYLDVKEEVYIASYIYHSKLKTMNNKCDQMHDINICNWFLTCKSDFDKSFADMKAYLDEIKNSVS